MLPTSFLLDLKQKKILYKLISQRFKNLLVITYIKSQISI